jgi:hypothetical protein
MREQWCRNPLFEVPMNQFAILLLLLMAASRVFARLGDTADQAISRYGIPKVEQVGRTPLIEGARELLFEDQGWRIRCALLLASNGKEYVVREEFCKIWNAEVMKQGGRIARKTVAAQIDRGPESESGEAHCKSSPPCRDGKAEDGATANRQIGGMFFRLELPQAVKYEAELKAIKERYQREAVPKF